MRPVAIALYYSIENIRNNVCQKIIIIMIIIYEKFQFNSLVCGSNKEKLRQKYSSTAHLLALSLLS